jgi:hypothetical protein
VVKLAYAQVNLRYSASPSPGLSASSVTGLESAYRPPSPPLLSAKVLERAGVEARQASTSTITSTIVSPDPRSRMQSKNSRRIPSVSTKGPLSSSTGLNYSSVPQPSEDDARLSSSQPLFGPGAALHLPRNTSTRISSADAGVAGARTAVAALQSRHAAAEGDACAAKQDITTDIVASFAKPLHQATTMHISSPRRSEGPRSKAPALVLSSSASLIGQPAPQSAQTQAGSTTSLTTGDATSGPTVMKGVTANSEGSNKPQFREQEKRGSQDNLKQTHEVVKAKAAEAAMQRMRTFISIFFYIHRCLRFAQKYGNDASVAMLFGQARLRCF